MNECMSNATVIIPFFGNYGLWWGYATRAASSVIDQSVITNFAVLTGDDIQSCRNTALDYVKTDWIIFLDADDELHPEYIEQMLKTADETGADIIVPSVHRYYPDGRIDTAQTHYQPKNLLTGNYIVVSAMIRTSLFKQLGGFQDYESLEDWDLWLRAEEAGAKFSQCPEAILKVHKRPGSRNSNKSFDQILNNAKQRRGIA